MSSFQVTVEKLVILPHPNADALELAQVGGYRAVVAKGRYVTGDLACYIPEQAVLPAELIAELGLEGKLAGSAKNRVKAVRLRGELSQGIVFTPAGWTRDDLVAASGEDLAERFGITKWVPPVPTHFAGKVEPCADLVPMIDIENIKRFPDILIPGERVVASEKLHGSALVAGLVDGVLKVSSKGFSGKRLAILEDPKNLYWRAVRAHDLEGVLRTLADRFSTGRVFLFGEVFGAGVQDLSYGADASSDTVGFAAFDLWVGDPSLPGGGRYLNPDEFAAELSGLVRTAPVLFDGPYDPEAVWAVASGPETFSGSELHIREGVVARPAVERVSNVTGYRAIAKFVSDDYLTRKGGTEYE